MDRELTNKIRFLLEEITPPFIRDSRLFLLLASYIYGTHMRDLYKFRLNAWRLTPAEYENLYQNHPRIHSLTDNSRKCVKSIIAHVKGSSILDVGCGSGYLISRIKDVYPKARCEAFDLTDINLTELDSKNIAFKSGDLTNLPYHDNQFDTVICTHVLEHVLDLDKCISELRRVSKQRIILVVPRERESLYAFNPHLQFFPYKHSLLRAIRPQPDTFYLEEVDRDFFYVENKD